MKLLEIVNFLDDFLGIAEWKEPNGLQVEGRREVNKIAFAVDASIKAFEKAKLLNADMLVVHHGIIWGEINHVRGLIMKRLKFLLENEISLYAAHLPLDAHPKVGNNAVMLKMLGARIEEPFGLYHGKAIGFSGSFDVSKSIDDIVDTLKVKLGVNPKVLNFGGVIRKIASVSGKGAFAVSEAAEKEIDVLVTGEAEHGAYHAAKEASLNVVFAGHYATETLGVKALMKVVDEELDVEVEFMDIPTGL
jgi:dinuclear metal center YbgI/SA1388 family protein